MRKRITSLLLTLAMLLSLLPAMGVTASAAEPEWTTVNTYAELEAALSNQNSPDNIKLGSDIDTGTLNSGVGILDGVGQQLRPEGNHPWLDLQRLVLPL